MCLPSLPAHVAQRFSEWSYSCWGETLLASTAIPQAQRYVLAYGNLHRSVVSNCEPEFKGHEISNAGDPCCISPPFVCAI